jgi:hypothetical protein
LKIENFPLSLSLKNSKKPKTWFGTRWSATWIDHAEGWRFWLFGKERGMFSHLRNIGILPAWQEVPKWVKILFQKCKTSCNSAQLEKSTFSDFRIAR